MKLEFILPIPLEFLPISSERCQEQPETRGDTGFFCEVSNGNVSLSPHLKEFRQEDWRRWPPSITLARPGWHLTHHFKPQPEPKERGRNSVEGSEKEENSPHRTNYSEWYHLAPYTVITMSLMMFPMLYFTSLWLFFSTGLEVSCLKFNI